MLPIFHKPAVQQALQSQHVSVCSESTVSCQCAALHSLLSLLMQRIDFNKLDTVALKRYRRIHKLDDVGSNPTKEELVSAVGKHFTAQVIFFFFIL